MENLIESLGGELLSYGVSGFALIMIGFTYYLMRSELKREEPRRIAIKTIWGFMTLVLVSTAIVGFFSLPVANKNDELTNEINELTSDMSKLMGLVTQYQYAITRLVKKLENNNRNPKPTKPYPGTRPDFDATILNKYFDVSKMLPIKTYKIEQIDELLRKKVKKDAKLMLNQKIQ